MNRFRATNQDFWENKYRSLHRRYRLSDPLYGRKGLLAKALLPWTRHASNVLELGCGSSRFLMFFNLVAGLETFGLDYSETGLAGLEGMARPFGVSHHLYLGDMFESDLENRKFDVVFHSGLIEHFSDLNRVFTRCRFFCRTGGTMIFLIPLMQNMAWQWHRLVCPRNYRAHIRYTRDEVLTGLRKNFEPLMVKSFGYPQIYAGGPPENIGAVLLKNLNLGLAAFTTLAVPGFKGAVGPRWASHWLFIARARQHPEITFPG